MNRRPIPCALGIDAGSISLELCAVDGGGAVLASCVTVVEGDTRRALRKSLAAMRSRCRAAAFEACCATGSGRHLVAGLLGCATVNEITAHALGTAPVIPDGTTASVIEIGGQDSKFIQIRKKAGAVDVLDHAMNTLCAAGTGTFFDGLAGHLGLTTARLAAIAAKARTHAHVAGRCVVFSRSDLIHLCQKGVALEEIALGICHAAARNVAGTVIRGRPVHDPVYFTGGVAANRGMRRALRELFGLREGLPIVPEGYRIFGAVGAGLHALESGAWRPASAGELVEKLGAPRKISRRRPSAAAVSVQPTAAVGTAGTAARRPPRRNRGGGTFAGLDVGSTSVKWAVLSEKGDILDAWYGLTQGDPSGAMRRALEALRASPALPPGGEGGLSITGSGRKFAAALLGCRSTVNEVTAMVHAARLMGPDVDTLFEIGGQDAKYVSLAGGSVEDFALNIACSAGTGALLVDESARFGVDLGTFDRLALACRKPAAIHSRCNVFMDSDLVYHMQNGESLENIAGGLMRAVAANYIEKVVEKRRIGRRVLFLGGVSRLAGMRRSLEAITGKDVTAPPWGYLSGAVGAARVARALALEDAPVTTDLKGLELPEIRSNPSMLACGGCPCSCTVTKIEIGETRRSARRYLYTGDGCGRYDAFNRGGKAPSPPRESDILDARREKGGMGAEARLAGPGDVGVPRAHQSFEIGVFLSTLLDALGVPWGWSKSTTPATIQRGEQLAPAQHCLPVKTAIAHCRALLEAGASAVLVPEILRLDLDGRPLKLCVYSQQLASFVRTALARDPDRGAAVLSPKIMLSEHRRGETCDALRACLEGRATRSRDVEGAFDEALAIYRVFRAEQSVRGASALRGASRENPAVIVFGRPYSIYDAALNLQVARRLQKLGVAVVPYDAVSGVAPVPDDCATPWLMGEEQIRAARAVAAVPHAYPLALTYYGCGVDAFLAKHLGDIVGQERPFLSIELDGHGAEAGLETRLEAFVDRIRTGRRATAPAPRPPKPREEPAVPESLAGRQIAMPFIAPHVHAFAAIFRRKGLETLVLPQPDDEVRLLGERCSNGRECNPYFYLVGDLVRWAGQGSIPPEKKVFFIPTSSQSSCLISQFGKGFASALAESGADRVAVWTPTGADLMDMLSLEEKRLMWEGLLAIDYLFRLSASRNTAGRSRGAVWEAFRRGLDEIAAGIVEGRTTEAIRRAIGFVEDAAEGGPAGDRLRIGVIGDVYTRINAFANQCLYETLEAMGCEVLAPPFLVDLLLYDMVHDPRRRYRSGNYASAAGRAAISVYQWAVWNQVRALFPLDTRILRDGDLLWGPGDAWYEEASKYLNVETEGLLAQNLGKAVDHIRNGADGIVNVMCHGCMIGTSTEAVLPRLGESHGGVPVISLSYDSLGDVHTRTRLEAFIELVRSWRKRSAPARRRTTLLPFSLM